MHRLALGAFLTLCLGFSPVHAETLLHLGETATVMAAPDELAATLRAEAVSPSASTAQSQVNALVADGLAKAAATTGIVASTGGYGVWRTGPTPTDRAERWQAGQSINLSSRDGAALLTLIGELQRKGFALSNLNWRLSRDAERQARQTATRQALSALRGRTEEAAGLLDLRFVRFKDVRLDSAQPQPVFRGGAPIMMTAAAPAAPPSAVSEDIAVNASVEADAILEAR